MSPRARMDELPTRILCVDVDPVRAEAAWGPLLARHRERGDRVQCLYRDGARAVRDGAGKGQADGLDPAWGAPRTEGFPVEDRSLDQDPLLVERLRATLDDSSVELVYGPGDHATSESGDGASDPGAHLERRALGRALRAALVGRTGVRLLEPDPEGPLAIELSGSSGHPGNSRDSVTHPCREVALDAPHFFGADPEGPQATAVICTWNKCADVVANLEALRAQTRAFADVIVVDNASSDGTAEVLARDFPDVRLIVMPHSNYGACETFNIGFASATTPWTVILDDDVVLPPSWLERAARRLQEEPDSTAVLSSKIVEPGMPDSYRNSPEVNRERYMSTFRGCASLARSAALAQAGGYDERLYIYGNERDLTCRLLNLGYRVLQFPGVTAYHKTPFGVQMGKRSLYYHARNAWIGMLKYAPLGALLRMPFLVVTKVLLRGERAEVEGKVSDATGTIGLGKSIRQTPGAWWVLVRAGWSVLMNVPYCLRHRAPVRSADFELPIQ